MKTRLGSFLLVMLVTTAARSADLGWPRVFKQDGKQLTVYQPQVDYWHGYTNIHFRCAIGVKGVTKEEKFGVAEIDAVTVTDQADRTVALVPTQRDIRFPDTSDSERAGLLQAVNQLRPLDQAITISLDRVLACLNPEQQPTQPRVELNLQPPRIYYSSQPAILVTFLGDPKFKPVEKGRTNLLFALNTNWDILYDPATQLYYLLNRDNWLLAPDVNGPWTPARTLPRSLWTLPANENWSVVRTNLPGKRVKTAPIVYVSTQPAELIVTRGDPSYSAIPGTQLYRITDTDSVLFSYAGNTDFYYLVAGRWFRAPNLHGPWSPASRDLPADFSQIPDSNPSAFVKASVPGTREAKDAVLLASVPTTTTVNTTNVTLDVTYAGPPQFVLITNTVVKYAVNSPYQVFLVNDKYYCCSRGMWFCGASATGPWSYCTGVPSAIYTIPPSSPAYNVTYVKVQSSTPTTVTYSQTAGYSGEYVSETGVLMFGTGMLLGAALASDNDYYYYYPPYPYYYSYGCGAVYHYGYGGYYRAGYAAYGPYGGAGYTAAYNPYTGTYGRSSYAYGPYGSASHSAAYNPYTGARAAGGRVSTAYGSAGRAAAYNPTTGRGAVGGYRSGAYGSAAGVRTTQGAGAATWNTANRQGAVARTRSGNVYASNGDTVYRRDSDGSWSQNSGSGWESVQRPQPQTQSWQQQRAAAPTSDWSQNRQNLESQARARSWGDQQHQAVQSWQSSRGSWGGSRWGGGGWGGRRRR